MHHADNVSYRWVESQSIKLRIFFQLRMQYIVANKWIKWLKPRLFNFWIHFRLFKIPVGWGQCLVANKNWIATKGFAHLSRQFHNIFGIKSIIFRFVSILDKFTDTLKEQLPGPYTIQYISHICARFISNYKCQNGLTHSRT